MGARPPQGGASAAAAPLDPTLRHRVPMKDIIFCIQFSPVMRFLSCRVRDRNPPRSRSSTRGVGAIRRHGRCGSLLGPQGRLQDAALSTNHLGLPMSNAPGTARIADSTPPRSICKKPDPSEWPDRRSQPTTDRDGPRRQGDVENGRQPRNHPASCCLVRQDQNGAHGPGPPATLARDERRHDAHFDVHRAKNGLEADKLALDLDEQHDSGSRMPCQDVNGPAVPVAVERVLDYDLPLRAKAGYDLVHQPGVAGIHQSFQLGPIPAEHQVHCYPERRCDPPDGVQRRRIGHAALDTRHRLLRHARKSGEI